jgi:DNA-binding transcriptional LysR family regulator
VDRLDTLTTFVTVADVGGFAAAARTLRVSPSAVTRAIAALETRLGVQLLQRTTRQVRLTEAGQLFLERCRSTLRDLEDAERLLMGAAEEPQGLLSITAPLSFGRLHVTPIVDQLLRAHPRLNIRLLLLDRVVQLVEEGVDVAVRIGELSDSALHAVRVAEARLIVVASPGYLRARGRPEQLDALRDHDVVVFSGVSPRDEWRFGAKAVTLRPRLVVNSSDAAILAAEGGLGVTRVMSYQAAEALRAGRLVRVLDEFEPPAIPVSLVFQAGARRTPAVQAFIDTARERLRAASASFSV